MPDRCAVETLGQPVVRRSVERLVQKARTLGLRLESPAQPTLQWLRTTREVVDRRARALLSARPGPDNTETFEVGDVSSRLRVIAGGTYSVGEPEDPNWRPHSVLLTRAFAVGLEPVTQALWEAVSRHNPSKNRFDTAHDHPVEHVSWHAAAAFCNRLSEACGLAPAFVMDDETVFDCDFSSPGFRLPTEHEWEVAARAGRLRPFASGEDPRASAWYKENAGGRTHPVGTRPPNAWGFRDLCGNVREWTYDHSFGELTSYGSEHRVDPTGLKIGALRPPRMVPFRVRRGGGWNSPEHHVRVTYRRVIRCEHTRSDLGFRLARTLPVD